MTELSSENQENFDKLVQYLINYAFNRQIGIEWTHKLPVYAPPISYNEPGKLIIMNANARPITVIPFELAHEIGHVLLENEKYYHYAQLGISKGEASSNLFAIKLLKKYCDQNDYKYKTWYDFAWCFAIPKEVYYLIE